MSEELKNRSKQFSLDIMDLIELLPKSYSGRTVADQLVRSATSVGANYRAACRARSDKEFIAKMHIVIEEIDECSYWLELIEAKEWLDVSKLLKEANELVSIFVTINKKVKVRLNEM